MGGVGVVLGQFLALGLALIQKKYSIIPLPEESYYMDVAPVALNGLDFVIVGLSTLLLCAVAACIPAFLATFIKPFKQYDLDKSNRNYNEEVKYVTTSWSRRT